MGMVDGKVAIVTGATSGVGTRRVEGLIEEGSRVVFCGAGPKSVIWTQRLL
jgi:NADP-dependent 3-hydroxy acid dehydrogenase YdfG